MYGCAGDIRPERSNKLVRMETFALIRAARVRE